MKQRPIMPVTTLTVILEISWQTGTTSQSPVLESIGSDVLTKADKMLSCWFMRKNIAFFLTTCRLMDFPAWLP